MKYVAALIGNYDGAKVLDADTGKVVDSANTLADAQLLALKMSVNYLTEEVKQLRAELAKRNEAAQ